MAIKIDLLEIAEMASAATTAASALDPKSDAANWAALAGRFGLIAVGLIRRAQDDGIDLDDLFIESFEALVRRKVEQR